MRPATAQEEIQDCLLVVVGSLRVLAVAMEVAATGKQWSVVVVVQCRLPLIKIEPSRPVGRPVDKMPPAAYL